MMYCVLVSSGLVFNIVGPFRSKQAATTWLEDSHIKTGLVVPLMPSGAEDET